MRYSSTKPNQYGFDNTQKHTTHMPYDTQNYATEPYRSTYDTQNHSTEPYRSTYDPQNYGTQPYRSTYDTQNYSTGPYRSTNHTQNYGTQPYRSTYDTHPINNQQTRQDTQGNNTFSPKGLISETLWKKDQTIGSQYTFRGAGRAKLAEEAKRTGFGILTDNHGKLIVLVIEYGSYILCIFC